MKSQTYLTIACLAAAVLIILSQYPLSVQIEASSPMGAIKVHVVEQLPNSIG
jgi:hypothetical protein